MVHIQIIDGSLEIGRIFTIDPETHNIIICTNSGNYIFLPSTSITKICVVDADINHFDILKTSEMDSKYFSFFNTSDESCNITKEALVAHFKNLRIPVEIKASGDVVIAGAVTCKPPFGPQTCYSTNDIILGRIQTLIAEIK